MSNIKCKAKNPATCYYHGVGAETILQQNYLNTDRIYNNLVGTYAILQQQGKNTDRYVIAVGEALKNKDKASVEYYATEEGTKELQQQVDSEEDLNKKLVLESLQKYVIQVKVSNEKQGTVYSSISPSRSSLYVVPDFRVNKIDGNCKEYVGNKYDSTYSLQRIRDFVKSDIRKAAKLGFLPKETKVEVKIDLKQNRMVITLKPTVNHSIKISDKQNVLKQIASISKSYAKAVVRLNRETNTETVEPTFNVELIG